MMQLIEMQNESPGDWICVLFETSHHRSSAKRNHVLFLSKLNQTNHTRFAHSN